MNNRTGLALLMWMLLPPPAWTRAEEPRTVDSILAEVESLGQVDFEVRRKSEPGYLDDYRRRQRLLYLRKASLLLEACRLAPSDPRVVEWMPKRWHLLGWNQDPLGVADEILADIDMHLSEFSQPTILQEAGFYRAQYRACKVKSDANALYASVTPFTNDYPTDPRGAPLLQLVADAATGDEELARTIYRRLAAEYPGTHQGKFAPGKLRRIDSAGKPFELSFDDAITGRRVSMSDLRWKVVLVDFWATTCVPCVEEMPRLREMYGRLVGQGVEFVGVSVDAPASEGGLKALRDFVSKTGIPWAQYHQGNGYDSAFSKSWGVGSAPTKFLIDANGVFVGTVMTDEIEARIKALLAK